MADSYLPDETDLEIIDLLVENGRLSAAEIANRIGDVSERTIRNRLNALIEHKLIHIGALPDPNALGLKVFAEVMVSVEPGQTVPVAERLVAFENINYLSAVLGHYQLMLEFGAEDVPALYAFVDTIRAIPGVRETEVIVIPMILKTFGYTTQAFEKLRAEHGRVDEK